MSEVVYDSKGKAMNKSKANKMKALFAGYKGANDENLMDWVYLPIKINEILRNDLRKLRARSRDLARNDDTAIRYLNLLNQNVLGHAGINMQAKNKLRDGKKLDKKWNEEIEREYKLFCKKRRRMGNFQSPSACGQMAMRELEALSLRTVAIDGECFVHILKGYEHNKHRFAVRFLDADLLDSGYCGKTENGNTIDMGIEFDEYERPVAYHFSKSVDISAKDSKERTRIPANQIIHLFEREFVGQKRGIPVFAGIMQKTKMLNGVNEAIVIGWRVASAKMGFFTEQIDDEATNFNTATGTSEAFDDDEEEEDLIMNADPGTFERLPAGLDFKEFNPDYPTSSYEAGHGVFMQQLANGLNVSTPTLSNNWSKVNYSSLRQALLEDRDAWRCIQTFMIENFKQPLFDEWYDWSLNIMGAIKISATKQNLEPVILWQARGWAWVDPTKEMNANETALSLNLTTRQKIMSENSGADFIEVADGIAYENEVLQERGLNIHTSKTTPAIPQEEDDDEQ